MPRIVRISDLTDKEKEEWEKRLKANNTEINLPTAKKNVEVVNNKSKTTLPVKVVSQEELKGAREVKPSNLKQDTKNALSNLGLGLQNGLISFAQQASRATEYSRNQMDSAIDEPFKNKYNLPTTKEVTQKLANNIFGEENKDKSIVELITGHNVNNQLEKQKNINTWNIQENIDKTDNKVLKKLAEVNPSIGQMAPGLLDPTGIYFIGSASGNYYDEAINQRGMDEDSAIKYSGIMGLMEGVTEIIGGALAKGVGKNVAKGAIGEAAKLFGIDIAENFVEEAVMEPIGEFTAEKTGGKETANWSNIGKRMLESGVDGAIVATVMSGVGAGTGKILQAKVNQQEIEYKTSLVKEINNSKLSPKEKTQMLQLVDSTNIDEKSYNYVKELINQTNSLMEKQETKNNEIPVIEEVIQQNNPDIQETNQENNYKLSLLEEINNSKMSNEEKMQMLQLVESSNINEDTYNDIREAINQTNSLKEQQTIAQENKTSQNDNILPMNTRQKYMKYKNDTNTYDATEVNEVLDITPTNRNGKRTVKQWLQVANEIGTRLADKSDADIERIAYKSWFDTQPTKSITRYDNQAKTNLPFIKLTADEWVDTISKAANEARNKNTKKIDYTDNNNQTGKLFDEYSIYYSKNGVEQERFSDFYNKHQSDYDDWSNKSVEYLKNNGTVSSNIYNIDNNLVKLTTLDRENNTLYINELYVENQGKGTGTKVVNALKDYANKAGLTLKTDREVSTAKGFWDKTLNEEQKTPNIINEKVNNYIENIRENFKTNINIDSKIIQENNTVPINYKIQNEVTIFKKAKNIFNNLQRKVFRNGDTDIYVDNADIKESIHHTLKDSTQKLLLDENLAVYSQLDKVIENAIQISEDLENKGRSKFSDWKYFVSNVNIDGNPYVVEFDTTMKDGQRHFRLERLYKIKEASVATDSANNLPPRFECNTCFY